MRWISFVGVFSGSTNLNNRLPFIITSKQIHFTSQVSVFSGDRTKKKFINFRRTKMSKLSGPAPSLSLKRRPILEGKIRNFQNAEKDRTGGHPIPNPPAFTRRHSFPHQTLTPSLPSSFSLSLSSISPKSVPVSFIVSATSNTEQRHRRPSLPFPSPLRQPQSRSWFRAGCGGRGRPGIGIGQMSQCGSGNGGPDFELAEEILAVMPTDPYDQLDLARKITSMAIASRVSKLESDVARSKQKLHDKDRIIFDLEEKVLRLDCSYQDADSRLKIVLDENVGWGSFVFLLLFSFPVSFAPFSTDGKNACRFSFSSFFFFSPFR